MWSLRSSDEHAAGAAMRRRQRRLRAWLRQERMTVAMALAESQHHTATWTEDGQGRESCSRRVVPFDAQCGGRWRVCSGRAADQPDRAAGGAGVEQIVDLPFVPILVVDEDPPLNFDSVRRWLDRKERKDREEREFQEEMVVLDASSRDGSPLNALERATWVAWNLGQQRRAGASDSGADRETGSGAIR